MRRNYRIDEHRIYHAWRRVMDCMSDVAPVVWHEFVRPVIVLAVGVGLSAPIAHVASRLIARFW